MPEISDDDYRRVLAFRTELRRFVRWSEDTARASGMTPAVHQLLLAVRGLSGDQGPTIGDVADVLLTRHHSTVELAGRAADQGLIIRTRGDRDHREVRLELTTLGATNLADITRQHLAKIATVAGALEQVARPSHER
ncbi:helix-turn-helix domain-containing protein [Patulibacter sp. NPDC049589]|uniref:helix-turn-helix domain-containing protein n=1 Tax=Patulibacter sp. NPDC049589 TaxID=3154731 RepID=UPI00342D8BB6